MPVIIYYSILGRKKKETGVKNTSSPNIVAYEVELKSSIETSVVLALTVRSFSSDKTNLTRKKRQ